MAMPCPAKKKNAVSPRPSLAGKLRQLLAHGAAIAILDDDNLEADLAEMVGDGSGIIDRLLKSREVFVFVVADHERDAPAWHECNGRQGWRRSGFTLRRCKPRFDARDPIGGLFAADLRLGRVHGERNAKIGQRGSELALVLIGYRPVLVSVEVLRKTPQRLVELHQRAIVVADCVVIETENVVHRPAVRIEPLGLLQIRERAVKVAGANETGGSNGMGGGMAWIEPDCFVEIRKRLIELLP